MNTFVLSLDTYPSEKSMQEVIEYANLVFFVVFLLEMAVKMVGLGCRNYFEEKSNSFDFFIVIVSTFEVAIYFFEKFYSGGNISQDLLNTMSKAGQVFRVFRLIRAFKLAKVWPEFNYFLQTFISALNKITPFIILLYLFVFMYTIMGMEIFSNELRFNYKNQAVPVFSGPRADTSDYFGTPDSTFNNFFNATISVFIVLANDGWSPIYFNHYRVSGPGRSTIYFISLYIIGQMILMNLFLAILL